jgi:hypothetical protein
MAQFSPDISKFLQKILSIASKLPIADRPFYSFIPVCLGRIFESLLDGRPWSHHSKLVNIYRSILIWRELFGLFSLPSENLKVAFQLHLDLCESSLIDLLHFVYQLTMREDGEEDTISALVSRSLQSLRPKTLGEVFVGPLGIPILRSKIAPTALSSALRRLRIADATLLATQMSRKYDDRTNLSRYPFLFCNPR